MIDIGQNGHHRTVAAGPPLITATSLDNAMNLSDSMIFGSNLAGGTLAQTADYWSGSGNSAGVIHAVDHGTPSPHGTQASSST